MEQVLMFNLYSRLSMSCISIFLFLQNYIEL